MLKMFELIEEDFQNPFEYAHYDKIKPCPFCGAKWQGIESRKGVYVYSNAPSSDQRQWLHVVCLECGSGASTIKVWNSRKCCKKGCEK